MSFQVALRSEGRDAPQRVRLAVAPPEGWTARVRRVGYVPVLHHNTPIGPKSEDVDGLGQIPGYVPDPLFDEDELLLPQRETHAFWITLRPGEFATPGEHVVRLDVIPEPGVQIVLEARVTLYDVALAPQIGFHITNWFYVDSLIDWYKTDLFDARFWTIVERYMRDVAEHGQDTLYVPAFTPALDGVKRPSQLMRVARTGTDTYSFDWSDVIKYLDLAQTAGITHFEWCHWFTQWGAKHAIRVYKGQGADGKLLWAPDTAATSSTYTSVLGQFLPQLHRVLVDRGLLERSFFHVSDEPHGDEHRAQYRENRQMLRELAPWMQVMDALTEIEFAREGLMDMPIPSIRTALDFFGEGIPSWCYYCCGPRGEYLQRVLDTPLPKIAMHGLLFYRWPFKGFLHWGYNYWYRSQTRELIDPYTVQDGCKWDRGSAYGDPFMVYPGPDGPIDSLRWEVFAESLQDYALLQTLGVSRDDERLAPIKSFTEFPKDEVWRSGLRRNLLTG